MKKVLKLLVSLTIVAALCVSMFCFGSFAAGTSIAFSSKTVTVGQNVTVSVTLNAGEAMYAASCIVNYDSSVLKYVSGQGSEGGAGAVKIVESPSGDTKVTYNLTFSAIKAGSCTVSIVDAMFSNGPKEAGLPGSSAVMNVGDATLSSNANLKSLRPSAGVMSPKFSANTTAYTIKVKNSDTQCRISAVAADSGAKVQVTGSATLKIGENTRTVVVTAPDGITQKTYTLTIIRSETDDEPTEELGALDVQLEDGTYTVATDISAVTLFKGFTASTADYNGTEVGVAVDSGNNYKIYYLTGEAGEPIPFTYNENNKAFEKLKYYSQGENTYIFAVIPKELTVPADYYATNATIAGMDISCFNHKDAAYSEFYYIYCFVDGNYGMYRYDSREGVMQRYPELSLVSTSDLAEKDNDGFLARFNSLPKNSKIIVLGLGVALLGAVALTVLLLVKIFSKGKKEDFEDYDDFDSISVNNFSLMTDEAVASEDDDDPVINFKNEE